MSISQLTYASIFIAILVLALKSLAAWLMGSIALWSDAIESTVNVATAIITMLAVRYAEKPADRRHPYGHGKIEYFAAVFQGMMILLAAIGIFYAALGALRQPKLPSLSNYALVINIAASLINGLWALYITKRGRAVKSPALIADGAHLFSDVWSSLGVLIGIVIAYSFNIPVLDPVLACIVALVILYSGFIVLNSSLNGLMDEAGRPDETKRILDIINAHSQGAIEAHDLRHRKSGRRTFIEFHLVVSGEMTVLRSHEICDRIETALRVDHEQALITIHVEPEYKAKH